MQPIWAMATRLRAVLSRRVAARRSCFGLLTKNSIRCRSRWSFAPNAPGFVHRRLRGGMTGFEPWRSIR